MADESLDEGIPADWVFAPGMAEWAKAHPEIVAGLREGLKDYREGRMRPWEDVKKELGLGESP